MREAVEVDTEFGAAIIPLTRCEMCGTGATGDTSYCPFPGWLKLTTRIESSGSRKEQDYCSVDCLVAHLVPDIYSADPYAALTAVNNLRKIEKELA